MMHGVLPSALFLPSLQTNYKGRSPISSTRFQSHATRWPETRVTSYTHVFLKFFSFRQIIVSVIFDKYGHITEVRINLFLLPIFPTSSHSIVVFFLPVGFSLLKRHSQQVWIGQDLKSDCQQETEETSTPYKTC